MEIKPGYFYFVSDSFFEKVGDPHLMINYEDSKRLHFFAFADGKTGLCWLVPCSSRVEKYKKVLDKKRRTHKPTRGIKIVKLFGKESALLFQDMFPVLPGYIVGQYVKGGQEVRVSDPKKLSVLAKNARKVVRLIRNGVKLVPARPDALEIEKIMLREQRRETQSR